jgi:hypothetical protein
VTFAGTNGTSNGGPQPAQVQEGAAHPDRAATPAPTLPAPQQPLQHDSTNVLGRSRRAAGAAEASALKPAARKRGQPDTYDNASGLDASPAATTAQERTPKRHAMMEVVHGVLSSRPWWRKPLTTPVPASNAPTDSATAGAFNFAAPQLAPDAAQQQQDTPSLSARPPRPRATLAPLPLPALNNDSDGRRGTEPSTTPTPPLQPHPRSSPTPHAHPQRSSILTPSVGVRSGPKLTSGSGGGGGGGVAWGSPVAGATASGGLQGRWARVGGGGLAGRLQQPPRQTIARGGTWHSGVSKLR